MSDGLGESLLGLCIDKRGFTEAASNGLSPDMLGGAAGAAWLYCIDLITARAFPSKEEVRTRFDLDLKYSEDDSIEGLVRRIRDRAYLQEIKPILEEGYREVSVGNPSAAVDKVLGLARIRAKYASKVSQPLSYKRNFEERILHYKMVKEAEGLLGAASRWPTFNRVIGGWQAQFYVVAAMSSVGKSWALMIIAEDLLDQGRRPLIVTTEMAPVRLQFRLDCVRHKIPFPLVRDGKLEGPEEERWMRTMFDESEDDSSDAIFVGKDDVRSVSDVQLLAQEYGATDVIIDGGYRLAQSREWDDQSQVVQEIQIAQENSGLPWIVTTQLGDSSEKGKSYDKAVQNKWNTRYAKEWFIDPDVLLLLSQPKDLKLVKQMQVEIGKWRDGDGAPVRFRVNWDPSTMDYSEVDEEDDLEGVVETIAEIAE